MNSNDLETEVLKYLTDNYSEGKSWFKSERMPVDKHWTFQEHFNFPPEDIDDMLSDIFTHFNIDFSNFDAENYFECQYAFWQKKPPPREKKLLTVEMIIESAKAGRWLYD
ncbi:putative phage-associated acyl carrier protein [Yersinia aldovae]|uniref:DUF1493 family protein n=1 Tax=Yersinia aldovae TaxID=29483 RepID=UPI0005E824EF|nr:DUF1493 family protein [Yersinia aldovae]CNH61196.1 putative phage-associated acyl carrier protein [Yersinia aldovae]